VSVSPAAQNLVAEIENKLREEEWLISEWSPIHLRNTLKQWYLKDDTVDVGALKVWQDSCHYLYLPRLVNDKVFINAITAALASEDFFAFASGKDGDRYLGFVFGQSGIVMLDSSSLFIDREAAEAYRESIKPPEPEVGAAPIEGDGSSQSDALSGGTPSMPSPIAGDAPPAESGSKAVVKNKFYGTIDLDPVRAKMDFSTLVDEVVQQFTAKLGVDVKISIEIQAKSRDGFDESLQRTIKENCNVLRFSSSEFEGE